jgi:hypothetical protein
MSKRHRRNFDSCDIRDRIEELRATEREEMDYSISLFDPDYLIHIKEVTVEVLMKRITDVTEKLNNIPCKTFSPENYSSVVSTIDLEKKVDFTKWKEILEILNTELQSRKTSSTSS